MMLQGLSWRVYLSVSAERACPASLTRTTTLTKTSASFRNSRSWPSSPFVRTWQKDSQGWRKTENLSACSSNYISVNCSRYKAPWPSPRALLPSRGAISTSSPTSRQLPTSPGGCYEGMACFTTYCSDWWGHSPPFHTHLFRVWDSLSAAFSFSPGSHHKSPAVVQLFTIAGNQQNQILDCYLFYVIWSFVLPFCMCVWSHHGTQDYSGSLHRSSQTEMIQQAISSSLPWATLVWLQQTERHGPHC